MDGSCTCSEQPRVEHIAHQCNRVEGGQWPALSGKVKARLTYGNLVKFCPNSCMQEAEHGHIHVWRHQMLWLISASMCGGTKCCGVSVHRPSAIALKHCSISGFMPSICCGRAHTPRALACWGGLPQRPAAEYGLHQGGNTPPPSVHTVALVVCAHSSPCGAHSSPCGAHGKALVVPTPVVATDPRTRWASI